MITSKKIKLKGVLASSCGSHYKYSIYLAVIAHNV
jgi:hypothetical protein